MCANYTLILDLTHDSFFLNIDRVIVPTKKDTANVVAILKKVTSHM